MWHNPAAWFEMQDFRTPTLSNSTWIPLFARHKYSETGEPGHDGYLEDYFQAQAICTAVDFREDALAINTYDLHSKSSHRPYVEGGEWYSAGQFDDWQTDCYGNHLVLEQSLAGVKCSNFLIDQDLVLGLGLIREGNLWLCPSEDFEVVIRTACHPSGEVSLIEIKANFLKDFLCARNVGLLVGIYRCRREVSEEQPPFELASNGDHVIGGTWEGGIEEIVEGGGAYGSSVGVTRVWQEGVDELGDVPVVPFGENAQSQTWEFARTGNKLYSTTGELWRNEWIDPAEFSPRVRRDYIRANVRFHHLCEPRHGIRVQSNRRGQVAVVSS